MKKIVLLTILLISNFTYAQWQLLGQTIFGDSNQNQIGYTTAVSGIGDRMVFLRYGSSPSNQLIAKVYHFVNEDWVQIGDDVTLLNGVNLRGMVAMNNEGNRFVAGTYVLNGEGKVMVFELENNTWVQIGEDITSEFVDDEFGQTVDMNGNGNVIVCGAPEPSEGYVKAYEFINNEWIQKGDNLIGDVIEDRFGSSVAINGEGNRIAVAAPDNDEIIINAGQVKIFEFQNGEWQLLGSSILGKQQDDYIGTAYSPGNNGIDLNEVGDVIAIGTWRHLDNQNNWVGQVNVHEFIDENWTLKGLSFEGREDTNFFGGSISLNAEGNIVAMSDISSKFGSQVVISKFENNEWTNYGNSVFPPNQQSSFFAFSIDMNDTGNILVVGDPDDGNTSVGQIHAFKYNPDLTVSEPMDKNELIFYPNPNNGDFFIKFSENFESISVHITDVSGKRISELQFSNMKEVFVQENISAGVYFVKVQTANSKSTFKMIVE
ncbi:T9SS type A sorting domain-containing protein [uncultured Marixanthomonas sp.]|uniref:T9SS type A sorting domain-containing protein n=1 Tax=uncultured Marixanthomonas sp. TaxID=757245 RepID=UPI0030D787FA|tara:strand:+ start:22926 stop:24389 length:1464 start_codon:yes stop_codon:yes gene_type:complete